MRNRWGATALIAGLALVFSAGAMPAYADPGNNGNPGNNNPGQNNTNNPGAEGGSGNPGNNNPGQNNTNNPGAEGASGTNANGTTGGAAGGNGASGNGGGGNAGGVGQTGTPPGANGTVKIHEFPEHKNGAEMATDPQVCVFEVHGFNFDNGQTGRWWIQAHQWGGGDAGQAFAALGIRAYGASAAGDWTDNNGGNGFRIANGHYKLFVELKHTAGNSGNAITTYKDKVFKVECPGAVVSGTTTGTTTTTSTGGVTESGTTTGGTTTGGTTTGGTASLGGTTGGGTTTGGMTAVAGFESAPSGGLDHMQPAAVAGMQSAPAELAAIASLPATSTAPDAPLGLIGLVLTTFGAALLRRTERQD